MTIDLGPLRPDEARALAGDVPAGRRSFAERCVERAAGNPLFLEQLLRHAEENAEAGVPGSVQSLVQARMDRLDPADKAGPAGGLGARPALRAATPCATCSADRATTRRGSCGISWSGPRARSSCSPTR